MSTWENPFRFLMRIVVFNWGIFIQSLFSCPRSGRSPPLIMIRWKNRKKMIEVPYLSVSKAVIDLEEPLLDIQFDDQSLVDNSVGIKLAFLDCIWSVNLVILDDEWMMQLCEGYKDWCYIEKSIFLIFIFTGLSWAKNLDSIMSYVKSTIMIAKF